MSGLTFGACKVHGLTWLSMHWNSGFGQDWQNGADGQEKGGYPMPESQSQGRASSDLKREREGWRAMPSGASFLSSLHLAPEQCQPVSLSSTGADVSTPPSPFKASVPTCQLPPLVGCSHILSGGIAIRKIDKVYIFAISYLWKFWSAKISSNKMCNMCI